MASAAQAAPIQTDIAKRVQWILVVWSCVALLVTVTGLYNRVPAPVVQGTILALMFAQLLCFILFGSFRAWTLRTSMQSLVLFQTWRILPGLAFLYYFYVLGRFT